MQRPKSGTERSGDQPDHSARGGQADSAARSSGVPDSGEQTRAAQALGGELSGATGGPAGASPPDRRSTERSRAVLRLWVPYTLRTPVDLPVRRRSQPSMISRWR